MQSWPNTYRSQDMLIALEVNLDISNTDVSSSDKWSILFNNAKFSESVSDG